MAMTLGSCTVGKPGTMVVASWDGRTVAATRPSCTGGTEQQEGRSRGTVTGTGGRERLHGLRHGGRYSIRATAPVNQAGSTILTAIAQ
jgi:hypothetical protein